MILFMNDFQGGLASSVMERLDTGLIAAQFRRSTSHRSRDARATAVVEQLLSEIQLP